MSWIQLASGLSIAHRSSDSICYSAGRWVMPSGTIINSCRFLVAHLQSLTPPFIRKKKETKKQKRKKEMDWLDLKSLSNSNLLEHKLVNRCGVKGLCWYFDESKWGNLLLASCNCKHQTRPVPFILAFPSFPPSILAFPSFPPLRSLHSLPP